MSNGDGKGGDCRIAEDSVCKCMWAQFRELHRRPD